MSALCTGRLEWARSRRRLAGWAVITADSSIHPVEIVEYCGGDTRGLCDSDESIKDGLTERDRLVGAAGCADERVDLSTLAELDPDAAGMRTVVIVGASGTHRLGDWLVTARSLREAAS